MDFLSRRTIRKYTTQNIEKEKLDEILKTTLASPSGRNLKPFELILTQNKDILNKLSFSKKVGSAMLSEADAAIIVLGNPEISTTWNEDSSIASFTIQLKAFQLGLGSCWINVKDRKTSDGIDSEIYIKNLLSIPSHFKIVSIISLGYPNEEKIPRNENDMDFSKIHIDKF
ncbi:MAG: nitroreductase family protein [Cetobacterium sp.]|uniref:nitroreductase family protein n=1 Tax=Cetobacterium sp. TaxID=2071632 RepID=UPI003F3D86BE